MKLSPLQRKQNLPPSRPMTFRGRLWRLLRQEHVQIPCRCTHVLPLLLSISVTRGDADVLDGSEAAHPSSSPGIQAPLCSRPTRSQGGPVWPAQ